MFSRAAAAAAATARRAERAARHRPPPSSSGPSAVGLAFAETTTPTFARRARSCASTARWTAPATPLATDASARASERAAARAGFERGRRSFASSSAAAAGVPHETAFADIETEAERAAARAAAATATGTETGSNHAITAPAPTITRTPSPMHRPREYAVPVRAYYVGNQIDFHALAKRLPAYPKEFFRECVVVRMTPRRSDEHAGSGFRTAAEVGTPTLASKLAHTTSLEGQYDDLNDGIHPGARAFAGESRSGAGKKARRGGGKRHDLEPDLAGLSASYPPGSHDPTSAFHLEEDVLGGSRPPGMGSIEGPSGAGPTHYPRAETTPNVGDTPRYLVVYKYGSAVFFNMGRREREECLKLVRSFAKTPLAVPCTDDYRVMVRPGLEPWAQFEADHVVLKRLDLNNISVIGTVLAQTVALEHHEIKVDNMIEIFSGLNKTTEETGEMDISKAKLFKLVAENNNTLTELVTRMRLLGRSDTAWQYAQYDAVWNGLRKDFELEDRFDHLDYKLNLIQTQVKFYLEILQNRKSDTLEWIIIVLISMEILVSLYDMSTKLG